MNEVLFTIKGQHSYVITLCRVDNSLLIIDKLRDNFNDNDKENESFPSNNESELDNYLERLAPLRLAYILAYALAYGPAYYIADAFLYARNYSTPSATSRS
ncbi:hypothetical protein B0A50_04619 [Salinomyces thailandicus]|uniref:Uncharacterized protein n=1 Tax=Salinomyces thailandicus TaxID=706561 RepID=A0A4U0TUU8_9PEZI|nr:hypothetical protein B0A50_04619 [Salinomyces thailandica]